MVFIFIFEYMYVVLSKKISNISLLTTSKVLLVDL
jgi:hypothetical protein